MIPPASDEILHRARASQSAWASLPVSRRCAILGELRRETALHCESIAHIIARETRKPMLDALSGDVLVTLEHLRYYESHTARILRPRRIGKPSFFFPGARFETWDDLGHWPQIEDPARVASTVSAFWDALG